MFPTLDLSYRAAGRIDQARLKVIAISVKVNIRNIFSWRMDTELMRIKRDKD